jgi:hypothetical protein
MLVVQPCTKHMAYRSGLVQISRKKTILQIVLAKGQSMKVLNILISIATNTLLTSFPIFSSQVVFG